MKNLSGGNDYLTFTTPNNANDLALFLYSLNGTYRQNASVTYSNIMLKEVNVGDDTYEPYKHDTIPFNIGTTEFCKLSNNVTDKLWVNLRTGQYGKTSNASNKYTIPTGSATITINDMKSNGSIISSIGGTVSDQTVTFSNLDGIYNTYIKYSGNNKELCMKK